MGLSFRRFLIAQDESIYRWRTRSSTGCCGIRETMVCLISRDNECAWPTWSSSSTVESQCACSGERLPCWPSTQTATSTRAGLASSNGLLQNRRLRPRWTPPEARGPFSTPPIGSSRKEGHGSPQALWHAPSTRQHWDEWGVGDFRRQAEQANPLGGGPSDGGCVCGGRWRAAPTRPTAALRHSAVVRDDDVRGSNSASSGQWPHAIGRSVQMTPHHHCLCTVTRSRPGIGA